MAHADFVHLRVHTAYSLSEGALTVKQAAELAKRNRMPALALTDTNNLFGALEFSKEVAGTGVQPIIGCQLAIARPGGSDGGLAANRALRKPAPDKLVVLAKDKTGFANLMRLTSEAHLATDPGEPPHISLEFLAENAEGLICLTGGAEGPIGRLVAEGQGAAASDYAKRLAAAFPNRLYVEIQRHGTALERRSESGMIDIAYDLDLPLVATNECFFSDEGMYEAHDALLCIAEGVIVAEPNRRKATREHRFKSAEEMKLLFADLPEAIANTLVVARRCAFKVDTRDPLLPHFGQGGESEADMLKREAGDGLEARLAASGITGEAAEPYRQRLAFECDVIIRMKFPGYFLIVADFIKWAKAQGIPVGPGRGSGAGSVVAWSLTITDLDPLKHGLLFERFLNPERVSMPDFDIDFCQDRRDEVIRYVQQKYGRNQVAQIITFGKLQARAALRDVGRVLALPRGQVDRICKMVPNNPANPMKLEDAIKTEPRLQEERDADENVARMMHIALKLEGLYRNASTHAAGVVIGDRPLVELVPLYRDPRSDMPATQYSMKYVESAGLVKFDFLGLKTLTVLQKAVELVALRGIKLDLAALPLEDKPTFDMLGRGETVGVFQLESSGMRDVLRQMKPTAFGDIVALVALYRPGPMDNIPRYIACKHGTEEPDYLHEWLKPVLEETQGVIIYQEQVMEIAKVLAGYSLGEADLLRRAMGKKIKAEMDAQKSRFIDGAVAKGVQKDRASYIFDLVEKFAGYGFNKSHAAAYALVAWQTAYLKANYPVEFLAASMSLDLGNTDKLNVFRQELGRLRIPLLAPDINRSGVEFTVEQGEGGKGSIRYALAAVRNVGADAMKALVAERNKGGVFTDISDLATRLDGRVINKRLLENLVKAGALDGLEKSRARMFAGLDMVTRHAHSAAEERSTNQVSLFGGEGGASMPKLVLPETKQWTPMEQLAKEFEAIGFYLSAHPLDTYAAVLRRAEIISYSELLRLIGLNPQTRRIAGTIIGKQERTARSGNRFAFIQCSDATGMFEVTVFSEILGAHRDLLEPGKNLIFTVDAVLQNDLPRLTVQGLESLDSVAARTAAGARIFINDEKPLSDIKTLLGRTQRGKGQIEFVVRLGASGEEAEIRLNEKFAVTPPMRQALKAVPGVIEVQEI